LRRGLQGARQVPPVDTARLRPLLGADAGGSPHVRRTDQRSRRAALDRRGEGLRLMARSLSRRDFLLAAGGAAGVAAAGAYLIGEHENAGAGSTETVPFYGAHQAGIATPAQERIVFGSF